MRIVRGAEGLPAGSCIPSANLCAPFLCAGALPLGGQGLPCEGFLHKPAVNRRM